MSVMLREAKEADADIVSSILTEAAVWLQEQGMALWKLEELSPDTVREEMTSHSYVLAEVAGEPAGTMRFQVEDPTTWPAVPDGDSAFIHRLAVRRKYAGGEISGALVGWAIERTREMGRRYLRLDCESDRERLRAVYEHCGFEHHSDRQVGPYHVARYEYSVGGHAGPDMF